MSEALQGFEGCTLHALSGSPSIIEAWVAWHAQLSSVKSADPTSIYSRLSIGEVQSLQRAYPELTPEDLNCMPASVFLELYEELLIMHGNDEEVSSVLSKVARLLSGQKTASNILELKRVTRLLNYDTFSFFIIVSSYHRNARIEITGSELGIRIQRLSEIMESKVNSLIPGPHSVNSWMFDHKHELIRLLVMVSLKSYISSSDYVVLRNYQQILNGIYVEHPSEMLSFHSQRILIKGHAEHWQLKGSDLGALKSWKRSSKVEPKRAPNPLGWLYAPQQCTGDDK